MILNFSLSVNKFYIKKTDVNQPKCYGVYGCFPITGPWTTKNRLNSVYPESPSKLNPHYPVFTKYSRHIPAYLDLNDPEETRNIGINPNGNIYLIAHGYIESGDRPWVQYIKLHLNKKNP